MLVKTNQSCRVAHDGYAIVADILAEGRLLALEDLSRHAATGSLTRAARGLPFAIRNLLDLPPVRELAQCAEIRSLVVPILGPGARCVRGIFFDKTPDANWKVPWHQDLCIAVQERDDRAAGYGPWSIKAGILHVQPPREVLESMLTVRLHLDDCDEDNGPLRVVPGSHRHGVLCDDEIREQVRQGTIEACLVPRAGAVLMRPLLLHASSAAIRPAHRRVVHLEFCASEQLPGGIRWSVE